MIRIGKLFNGFVETYLFLMVLGKIMKCFLSLSNLGLLVFSSKGSCELLSSLGIRPLSVCKLFTFLSSSAILLNLMELNLACMILGQKRFRFVQVKLILHGKGLSRSIKWGLWFKV